MARIGINWDSQCSFDKGVGEKKKLEFYKIQYTEAFLLGHFLRSIHIHTLHPSSTAPPCNIPSPLYFPFPGPFSFHGRTINSRGHWYAINVLASLPLLSSCARPAKADRGDFVEKRRGKEKPFAIIFPSPDFSSVTPLLLFLSYA